MKPQEKVDAFIGRKFGPLRRVEVIGWTKEKSGRNFKYLVHCSECAKDPELHGDANFVTARHSLMTGCLPCGCAKSPRWTKQQYTLRIERECSKRNYIFMGWATEKVSATAKIKLRCNEDGNEWTTTPVALVKAGAGCSKCRDTETSLRCKLEDEYHSEKFLGGGKFLEGTTFSRNGERRGGELLWDVTCPVCSSDEYVKSGLCSGVFKSVATNLAAGRKPCRCSVGFRWTAQMQEYRIRKLLVDDLVSSYVGWEGCYTGAYSKAIMHCSEHGNYEVTANAFINNGTRCPCCANYGYNPSAPGSLYVLRVRGETTGFTGYGISGEVDRRLVTHKRELGKAGFKIVESKVFDFDVGQVALSLENEIKRLFPRSPQVVSGFVTEATHTDLYDSVLDFIDEEISKEI